jgi:hypothetical protein
VAPFLTIEERGGPRGTLSCGDGTVDLEDLSEGDPAKPIGKVTRLAKKCNSPTFTPETSIRKILFNAASSGRGPPFLHRHTAIDPAPRLRRRAIETVAHRRGALPSLKHG